MLKACELFAFQVDGAVLLRESRISSKRVLCSSNGLTEGHPIRRSDGIFAPGNFDRREGVLHTEGPWRS
ncbi:MAG: hypothetical protein M1131_04945 [Actinobacteria bacterium]|jgi:hypothetical protein|nr:hypothetical protein [Actinomycetota bacterium]MCL6095278.1 hypothetical protein [Actinomycetota bacterium]